MFEFGLTEDILNGKEPVKLAHGIRSSRLANENFYMMLPTLDGYSLGCCDDVGACDDQVRVDACQASSFRITTY